MGLRDIAPIIEADNIRIVMEDTWGHLAPIKDKVYRGRIAFAVGCFDSGHLNPTPLLFELGDLDSSPWFYHAVHAFLSELPKQYRKEGCVYEWNGSFCNYEFKGKTKLMFNANLKTQ